MCIVVLVTAKDENEAGVIAEQLVERKLIACANIVKDIKSVFRWEGKVDQANEVLLILKSTQNQFKAIVATVKELHSYDTPEIIALPIVDGSDDYLNWVKESCAD